MTSEVLIMNRQGVALAADSAVTTRSGGSALVTMEAEKVFEIGQSIGLMVYNRGDLVGRSWSQIAHAFHSHNGGRAYGSVQEAADGLFAFMQSNQDLFPPQEAQAEFSGLVGYLFAIVVDHARFMMQGEGGLADEIEAFRVALDIYRNHVRMDHRGEPRAALPVFADMSPEGFETEHGPTINAVIDMMFPGEPPADDLRTAMHEYIFYAVTRPVFIEPFTGMVFAGFGENDTFPTSEVYFSSFLTGGRLKRQHNGTLAMSGVAGPRGIVSTFAQADMTHTFMRGIHPYLYEQMTDLAIIAAEVAAQTALEEAELDEEKVAEVMARMQAQHLPQIARTYEHYVSTIAQQEFTEPVLKVVEAAGKRQIAEIARILVELNIIKGELHQRQSGVGGDIDVAMITRKHGFEWYANKN